MNRIALAVALVAVPAPFKVAVTMQATVTTDLSASQTHIVAGSGACGFVDVNGSSHRTLQFVTPTPIVLSVSELTHPRPGRLLPGFTASSTSNAAFTETFSSPCSNNTCTSLSFGWFVGMFPSQAQVPCDKPLSSNETDCGTTPVPVDVRNVYAQNHDDLFTKFNAGELDVGVSLDGPRPAARRTVQRLVAVLQRVRQRRRVDAGAARKAAREGPRVRRQGERRALLPCVRGDRHPAVRVDVPDRPRPLAFLRVRARQLAS
jgi:hypothetical protein